MTRPLPDPVKLVNRHGLAIRIHPLGAAWISCQVPLADGPREILLGSRDLPAMLAGGSYLGATVGRYAGRIANARFEDHLLAANQPPNILHGGPHGFSRKRWQLVSAPSQTAESTPTPFPATSQARTMPPAPDAGAFAASTCLSPASQPVDDAGASRLQRCVLRLKSPAGDQGFPGNLMAEVSYQLDDDNTLTISFTATTDAATPCNLTNHAYFNLNGGDGDNGLAQYLTIHASHYQPTGSDGLPDSAPRAVAGTSFDFREPKRVDADFMGDADQQKVAGYDHSFLLDAALDASSRDRSDVTAAVDARDAVHEHDAPETQRLPDSATTTSAGPLQLAAELRAADQRVGIKLFTNQPALHLYTGQYLADTEKRDGTPYANMAGLALESQYPPDSPSHGRAILQPGQTYRHVIRYQFDF